MEYGVFLVKTCVPWEAARVFLNLRVRTYAPLCVSVIAPTVSVSVLKCGAFTSLAGQMVADQRRPESSGPGLPSANPANILRPARSSSGQGGQHMSVQLAQTQRTDVLVKSGAKQQRCVSLNSCFKSIQQVKKKSFVWVNTNNGRSEKNCMVLIIYLPWSWFGVNKTNCL